TARIVAERLQLTIAEYALVLQRVIAVGGADFLACAERVGDSDECLAAPTPRRLGREVWIDVVVLEGDVLAELRGASGAALGDDVDHARGGVSAVHRGGSRPLHHLDGLDVAGVDVEETAGALPADPDAAARDVGLAA